MTDLGNTTHAVRQQRRKGTARALDDFPTPPWGTRALCEHVLLPELERQGWGDLSESRAWDPAANRGFMVRPLQEYFHFVRGSDVHDYGAGFEVSDFLMPGKEADGLDWIITNPPFRLASQFAAKCEEMGPSVGYALLTRIAFLEGVGRFQALFRDNPPTIVAQFTERLPMVEGRYDPAASTASAYCWLVWFRKQWGPTRLNWIPPCRRALERKGDAHG